MISRPEPPEILYHYCSSATFLSLLKSRQLWAHQLSLSNDHMEGKWVGRVLEEECRSRGVTEHNLALLLRLIEAIDVEFVAGGFCLSEVGDLLSQWRGYTDDGLGISVGLSTKSIKQVCSISERSSGKPYFSAGLRQIVYDVPHQRELLSNHIIDIVNQLKELDTTSWDVSRPTMSDGEKYKLRSSHTYLWRTVRSLLPLLYRLKNPAFEEEREWRIISYMRRRVGSFEDRELEALDFTAKPNSIVPIRKIPMVENDDSFIVKIVLGPRNITPPYVIAAALQKFGLREAEITVSQASYR